MSFFSRGDADQGSERFDDSQHNLEEDIPFDEDSSPYGENYAYDGNEDEFVPDTELTYGAIFFLNFNDHWC